jgi:glyoxylase-like metal-dependent hydrolase (beta-lactamase superfamily II)
MTDRGPAEPPPAVPSEVPPMQTFDDGVLAIDTLTAGLTDVTAGYLLTTPRPVLIECGPARSVGSVLAALRSLGMDPDDLAYLVLSHIHLDHAGGAGDVAAAFPNATIVVSEHGARHLAEPARLNASSQRVYGPLFDTVYGACTPVPAERIRAVGDRDRLDLGAGHELELLHTPGHAKHHLGVHDPTTGAIFSGDSVGVKLPGMHHIRPATPPADFHLEAALASLALYQERAPSSLYLAHYGRVDPAAAALAEAAERLRLWAATAEAAWREAQQRGFDASHELDHVAETLATRFADPGLVDAPSEAAAADASTAAVLDHRPDGATVQDRITLLNDTRANAAGLLRYLHRRDEGSLTALG